MLRTSADVSTPSVISASRRIQAWWGLADEKSP
jgi:hypothetical protein